MASLVDDISRIEANSYDGVGVEKVYLHEGADVTRAISQLASSALVVLKYMPPGITPPLVLRYGATDVPIIQLSLSSNALPIPSSTIWAKTSSVPIWRSCTAPKCLIPMAANRASSWPISTNSTSSPGSVTVGHQRGAAQSKRDPACR